MLGACGGGNPETSDEHASRAAATAPTTSLPPAPAVPQLPTSQGAAEATAKHHPLCQQAQPFYWEIGDAQGALGSGSVDSTPATHNVPTATTTMDIASASKWPFATYVIEKHGSQLPKIVSFLNFTSGYSNFDNSQCNPDKRPGQTVAECNNGSVNGAEQANGTFHYSGGHMQQLAVNLGLGDMNHSGLGSEVESGIGSDVGMGYVEPQPPGGVTTTASAYALLLRKMMLGQLQIGGMLSAYSVCTKYDPVACPNASPEGGLPEAFHYGLGHWIEDDPSGMPTSPGVNTSNYFAYSSAGAFGFYPWISMDKRLYGILARQVGDAETNGEGIGYHSLECGRMIRLAWATGLEQKASTTSR